MVRLPAQSREPPERAACNIPRKSRAIPTASPKMKHSNISALFASQGLAGKTGLAAGKHQGKRA